MKRRGVNFRSVPKSVGRGRVLMHNHLRHRIDQGCGVNGFRGWTDTKRWAGFRKCGCGWSGLPHYSKRPDYICESQSSITKAIERERERAREAEAAKIITAA